MTFQAFVQKPILATREDLHWQAPFPGEKVALSIDGRDTGGRFGMAEALIDPMAGPPLHIHHDADEVIYVLDGAVEFEVAGERLRGGKGAFVLIPRGTPHAFRNFGVESARLLGFFTPGGMERMFSEVTKRPLEDFSTIAAEFSLEVVGRQLEPAV